MVTALQAVSTEVAKGAIFLESHVKTGNSAKYGDLGWPEVGKDCKGQKDGGVFGCVAV